MMDTVLLDKTKQMLDILGDEQLQAINVVAKTFVKNSPFYPKSEDEFMTRIDESIAQADQGRTKDAFESLGQITEHINKKRMNLQ